MPSVFTIEGTRGASGAQKRARDRMKKAAKACKGLKRGAFKACMKKELKGEEKTMKGKGLSGVDAFGLNSLGNPVGLNPMWGGAVGSGVGTAVSILARKSTSVKAQANSELIGLGAGAAAGVAMMVMPRMRAAGWAAVAAAVLNNGLREIEVRMARAKLAAGGVHGVVVDPTSSFRGVDIETTESFAAAQLPQLVGANLAAASEHVQLVGGPQLARHSGHWGSTVISS